MWAESNLDSEEVTFDPQEDISGPFYLGVALTRTLPSGTVENQVKEDNKAEAEKTDNNQESSAKNNDDIDNTNKNETEKNNDSPPKETDKVTDSNKDETENSNKS